MTTGDKVGTGVLIAFLALAAGLLLVSLFQGPSDSAARENVRVETCERFCGEDEAFITISSEGFLTTNYICTCGDGRRLEGLR